MKKISHWLYITFILIFNSVYSNSSYSSEIEETVLGMNVSGNKESPKLLYIIPWKDDSENATPPEVYRLMDEIYSTVDPDVFEKEVMFFEQLTESASPSSKVGDKQ